MALGIFGIFDILDFFTAVFGPAKGLKGFLDPAGIDSDQIWAQTDPPRPNSLLKLHFFSILGVLAYAYAYGICIFILIWHMHMPYAYAIFIQHMHMPYAYGIRVFHIC